MPLTPSSPLDALNTPQLPGRVIAMPDVYLPKEKKKLSSTAILGIVLGFVLILVGVVVALFLTRETPTAPVVQEPVVDTPVTQPEPTPTPEPVPVPQPEPTVAQVVLPSLVSGVFAIDVDTDQDSLTDVEERIFLTSAAVPDTDQDSFLDGIELRNLYDPATPRALLEVSPQIKLARNDTLGYQMLIPVQWTAAKNTTDGKDFIIRPEQGTESFRVMAYENPDRITVTEWLQQQQPGANLAQLTNFRNEAGWVGIQTQDHLVIIAAFDDGGPGARALIFVLQYDPGQESVLRYGAVWDTMANSLAVAAGGAGAQ